MADDHASVVLVVEDDASVRRALRQTCESEGFEVVEAESGAQALAEVERSAPTAVVLDVFLPDVSGLDVCRGIRDSGHTMPVMLLSDKSDEIDVVLGLEMGANDYIQKPFRPRELMARIGVHLRPKPEKNPRALRTGEILQFRDLTIYPAERRAHRSSGDLDLTHTEFDLLLYLASQAGMVLSQDAIFAAVWGNDRRNQSRVLPVHIGNLRRKVEDDAARPRYILTVPGVGYRFALSKPE